MKKQNIIIMCFSLILLIGYSTVSYTTDNAVIEQNSSLDEYLTQHFQVIDTNIKGADLGEKFEKAKVILLLEDHLTGGGQQENADLINSQWGNGNQGRNNDVLLTEVPDSQATIGDLSTTSLLDPKIVQQHKSWDLVDADMKPSIQPFENILQMERAAQYLITGLYIESETINDLNNSLTDEYKAFLEDTSRLILGTEAILKNKDLSLVKVPDFAALSHQQRFDFLYTLIPIVQFDIQSMITIFVQFNNLEFFKRNKSMVTKINENLKENTDNRIWIIAGTWHGQYASEKTKAGVDYLYNSLKQSNIPYITLKARKELGQPSQRELEGKNLNDPHDSNWNYQQQKTAAKVTVSNYIDLFNAETKGLASRSQWGKWMVNNIIKINDEKVAKVSDIYKGAHKMNVFLDYSLNKIYYDHVLEK